MIEPVAYVKIKDGKVYSMLRTATPNDEYTPLYTAEQLHPRVKMTRNQLSSLIEWKKSLDTDDIVYMLDQVFNFGNIPDSLDKDYLIPILVDIWKKFDEENPEETIEIVPDMKWFVRSKEKELSHYQFLAESRESNMPIYTIFKSYAMTFDTKEEAEKWTNPLTEAVQLPVEDE